MTKGPRPLSQTGPSSSALVVPASACRRRAGSALLGCLLGGAFLAGAFLAAVFLAGAFFATVFLAGAFLATVFLAGAFFAAPSWRGSSWRAPSSRPSSWPGPSSQPSSWPEPSWRGLLGGAFLAAVFLVVVFLAAAFLVFLARPLRSSWLLRSGRDLAAARHAVRQLLAAVDDCLQLRACAELRHRGLLGAGALAGPRVAHHARRAHGTSRRRRSQ